MNVLTGPRMAIELNGIPAPETLVADGLIHNYGLNKKTSNGPFWYCLIGNQVQMCAYGNTETGCCHLWFSPDIEVVSQTIRDHLMSAVKQSLLTMKKQFQLKMEKESEYAKYLLNCAEATQDHPYLNQHKVKSFGLSVDGKHLLIPIRDAARRVRSIQRISPDGEMTVLLADFEPGCYFSIGKPSETFVVCTDYVTAASIHMATDWSTAAAFAEENILPVVNALRKKFPAKRFLIAGDQKKGNSQRLDTNFVQAAACIADIPYLIPIFDNACPNTAYSFNDLHKLKGIAAVRAQLVGAVEVKHAE